MANKHCTEMSHSMKENSTSLDMDAIYAMLDGKPYDIKQHAGQKLPTDMNYQNVTTNDALPVKDSGSLDNIPIDMFIKENISPVSSSTDGRMIYICSFCNKEYKREKFLVKHMQICYAKYVRKIPTSSHSRRKINSCYYGNPVPTSRCILSQIQEYSLKTKQFQHQKLGAVPDHIQHPTWFGQTQQYTTERPIPLNQFPMNQLPFASKQFSPLHSSPNQMQLSPAHMQQSLVQSIPSYAGALQSFDQILPFHHQTSQHPAQTIPFHIQPVSSPTQNLQSAGQTLNYPAEIQEFPVDAQASLARMQRLHAQIKQQLLTEREQLCNPVKQLISEIQPPPVQTQLSPVQIEECFDEIQSFRGETQGSPPAQKPLSCVPVEEEFNGKQFCSSTTEFQQQSLLEQPQFPLDLEDLLN